MMIMKMLTRGAVLVGALWATQSALDSLEKSWNKRDERIKKNSTKEVKITEEQLKAAFEEVHRLSDEMEENEAKSEL